MQQILEFCLYYGNPLYVVIALATFFFLWGLLRKNLDWESTWSRSFLITLILSLGSPIFVEWPMGSAVWQKENGIWVRHTLPFFHRPFSFSGVREWDDEWDVKGEFRVGSTWVSCLVTVQPDFSNMATYCESVGEHWKGAWPSNDLDTVYVAQRTKSLGLLIPLLTKHPTTTLLDEAQRVQIFDAEFKKYGFRLKLTGIALK